MSHFWLKKKNRADEDRTAVQLVADGTEERQWNCGERLGECLKCPLPRGKGLGGWGGGISLCACFSIYTYVNFSSYLTQHGRWHRHYDVFWFVLSPLPSLITRMPDSNRLERLASVPIGQLMWARETAPR